MNPNSSAAAALLPSDFLQALGLDAVPEQDRQRVIEETASVIFEAVLTKVGATFTPEQQAEFDTILDSENPDPNAIVAFLMTIPNIQDVVRAEMAEYKAIGDRIQ